jgi:regulatory protein
MDEIPLHRAKAKALRLLAARPRTGAQIRKRLARDQLDEAADEVLEWLARLGYLDDAAYARARARSLLAPGRLGPRLAQRRLVAAGVSEAEAREAVAEALMAAAEARSAESFSGAEAELCRALAERRLRGASPSSLDEKARARLARFLLGRGFSGRAVARVLGAYVDQEE